MTNHRKVHIAKRIHTVEDLFRLIADVGVITEDVHLSTIYLVEGETGSRSRGRNGDGIRVRLEEDTLSDGSTAFNVIVGE